MKTIVFLFFGIFAGQAMITAQEINQLDENGKRHGVWKKKFPKSDQLRYEGTFDHGKEVGTFKFYCQDCKNQPMVIKEFSKNDAISEVKYFTKKGKLVSEGKMDGKNRMGEWVYYHEKANSVMTREFYKEGELDGPKTTYYLNNQVTEELNYSNGKRVGSNTYYSPEGTLLKKLQYADDELHGSAEYYDAGGNLTIKGTYLNGKKHGLWKYYKNGKLELEETYPKPRIKNN